MNELLKKIKPCDIDKPFIFISYSSKDADLVYEDVLHFQQMGYNIWLDEKNLDKTKASWKDDAINAILDIGCELVVFYVSRNSLKSVPCFNEMKSTTSEEAISVHLDPVKFIAVDVEAIDNIQEFVKLVHTEVRSSNISKEIKTAQAKAVTGFLMNFFNSNNERVRVHPKMEKNRKLDYYEEITGSFPAETRIYEPEVKEEPVPEVQVEEDPVQVVEVPPVKNSASVGEKPRYWGLVIANELKKMETAPGVFVIPEGYERFDVFITTSIFRKIKANEYVTSIVLPDSFNKLNIGEFKKCIKLESIKLSSGIKEIPSGCFKDCKSLHNIIIPDSVEKICSSAFSGCESLYLVQLPDSVKYIDMCAFENCYNLKNIKIPGSVETIRTRTFSYCKSLMKVTLASGVKRLESWCIDECGDVIIVIPSTVEYIDKYAFFMTKVVIHCEEGSYAHRWAQENGYEYKLTSE